MYSGFPERKQARPKVRADAEPYPGAGYVILSKPFRKKYPHIASVYGMHEDNETCEKPYLTTIGREGCGSARGELNSLKLSRAKAGSSVAQHQPKEWFLSMRLYDFDYAKLITYSPLDCPEVIEAIEELKKVSFAMMQEILRSDAKSPKLLMKELFGLLELVICLSDNLTVNEYSLKSTNRHCYRLLLVKYNKPLEKQKDVFGNYLVSCQNWLFT